MKEGWVKKRIDEVCSIARGGSPRPIKDYITNNPNGLNWIKIGDTDMGGKYIYSTKEKIKPEGLKKSRWVEEDEFLLSNSMSFGRPYILKTNGCIHDGWLVLREYQKYLNIDFFYYVLSSEYVQKQFRTKAQGSTVSNLNTDRVASVSIPVPPLSEQQSIVDYLDSAFAKIVAMKANAEKALNEAKALFQASLKKMLESKEGWEEKTIEYFAKIVHGKNQKDVLDSNGSYPIYGSGGNIMGYANAYLCDAGTTILGRKGTIDNPLFINEKFWNVDTAFGIIAKNNCNKKFLYYSIKNIDWAKRNTGTTLPSLTQNVVYNVEMCAPSLSEQQSIVATLDSLKSKVDHLQENYDKISQECDSLKQAILRIIFE